MTRILNIIQNLGLGGASRALLATARESARQGAYRHQVLSLTPADPQAVRLARENGLEVVSAPGGEDAEALIAAADIVQVHWWNVPEMTDWLRTRHGPMRLMLYYHVAGDRSPHFITRDLIDYSDISVACNPYTYEDVEAFAGMRRQGMGHKVAMAYGAADFSRLEGFQKRRHEGFNLGYIGTVEFHKMHPDFVAMSAKVKVPGMKVMVCGSGVLESLRQQARALGCESLFDIRGYVGDIRPVLEILDVYGYPLCEDTYAGSELNLQEAMWAGIPPVVFPHGGIRRLVVQNYTGLVATSAAEYAGAVEFLYHHPEERQRLGENAAHYARQVFGAVHAARKMNDLYSALGRLPKREREPRYGGRGGPQGADLFLATIAPDAETYRRGMGPVETEEARAADRAIGNRSQVVKINGLIPYSQRFPQDPDLHFWLGLMLEHEGNSEAAGLEFLAAHQKGLPHGRALARLGDIAQKQSLPSLKNWVAVQRATMPPAPSPAVAADPDSIPEALAGEYARLGADLERGEWEAGERRLRSMLQTAVTSPRLWNDLGVLLHTQGRGAEARACLHKALEMAPGYEAAAENLSALSPRH